MHPLAGVTNRSQRRGVDIIETYNNLLTAIKDIKNITNNIDKEFSKIFEQDEWITAKAGTQPSMPRLGKKQVNINNTETDCHYGWVCVVCFIDKLMSKLELR